MSTNRDATETPKDALGYDAISTYTINDGLGINALPNSKKYKKGIRENTTGRARTLGIWMSCPDCSFNKKFQEFIPRDHQYELTEDIERKECPDPDCKSKNFSVFMDGDDCNVGDRHEYLFMFGQSSKLGLESVSESIK